MNQFLSITAVVALTAALAFLVQPAQAATATATFNVTASLQSKCEVTGGPTDVAFTYTSFQTGIASSTGGVVGIRCTSSLPYSLSLTSTSGTVIGLAYTLTAPAGTFTGSGASVNHTISGSMAAGQGGTCASSATACTGSNQHTLTITY